MNAPDRFELFIIPEGRKKVEIKYHTKQVNAENQANYPKAATFTIEREDHTLANMLRSQLLKDPRVIFAGYKVPHPLEHNFELRVQTNDQTTPVQALKDATNELINSLNYLKEKFDQGIDLHRTHNMEGTSSDLHPSYEPAPNHDF